MDRQPIISAKDVEITFSLRGKKLNAIRKCSLDLYDGETLAIVGESGSGKSVFTKTFVGMLDVNGKITGGSIMYEGRDMTKFTEKDWLGIRGKKIAMVMQDPMTSLNPLKKIGKQIQESIEHHQGLHGEAAKKAAIEMLAKVGIPDPERRYEQYPHEFSGGMRQRVVIAIAAACRPQILICDEPTTALDVTIQAQILQLIRDLQKELGMSVIYITHDLGVVANVADRVAVMYAGQIVEYGTVEEIFYDAWHPYTWALLQALPQLGTKGEAKGFVTLVFSDKIRTLLKMIPLPKRMSATPDQTTDFNLYSYIKQLIDGNDVEVLLRVADEVASVMDALQFYIPTIKDVSTGLRLALEMIRKYLPAGSMSRIYVDEQPSDAGSYIAGAIALESGDLNTAGVAFFKIKPKTEGVRVYWAQEAPAAMTVEEARSFNAAAVVESDGQVIENGKVTYSYKKKSSFFGGTPISGFPTEPGTYTQTAKAAGNYSSEKITRTIVIN